MSYIHVHGRRSGRTTRLIEEAIHNIQQDRAVYILCLDKKNIEYMKSVFEKVCRSEMNYITKQPKFETLERLGPENIDWKNTKIIGAHHNCELLIDHSVYEHLFGHIINGYHEYDAQIAVNAKWASDKLRG